MPTTMMLGIPGIVLHLETGKKPHGISAIDGCELLSVEHSTGGQTFACFHCRSKWKVGSKNNLRDGNQSTECFH